MKQVKVFCINTRKNQLDFFVSLPTETVYLFTTKYFTVPIYNTYKNGIAVEKLFHATRQTRQQNLQEHLLRNLKNLEKESGISLFQKSKKWTRYPQTKKTSPITYTTYAAVPEQHAA